MRGYSDHIMFVVLLLQILIKSDTGFDSNVDLTAKVKTRVGTNHGKKEMK